MAQWETSKIVRAQRKTLQRRNSTHYSTPNVINECIYVNENYDKRKTMELFLQFHYKNVIYITLQKLVPLQKGNCQIGNMQKSTRVRLMTLPQDSSSRADLFPTLFGVS